MTVDAKVVERVVDMAREAVRKEHADRQPSDGLVISYLGGMVVGLIDELKRLTSAGFVRRRPADAKPPKERPPSIL